MPPSSCVLWAAEWLPNYAPPLHTARSVRGTSAQSGGAPKSKRCIFPPEARSGFQVLDMVRKGAADCPSSPLAPPGVRVHTVYFMYHPDRAHMRGQVAEIRSWSRSGALRSNLQSVEKDCAATPQMALPTVNLALLGTSHRRQESPPQCSPSHAVDRLWRRRIATTAQSMVTATSREQRRQEPPPTSTTASNPCTTTVDGRLLVEVSTLEYPLPECQPKPFSVQTTINFRLCRMTLGVVAFIITVSYSTSRCVTQRVAGHSRDLVVSICVRQVRITGTGRVQDD